MKRFLSQLLIFVTIPIIYFGSMHLINKYIYQKQGIDAHGSRLLIVGDSHPLQSVNSDGFESALNISQAAEPYVVSYWKLKKILKTNQVDTVLIGFAAHNISAYNDNKFNKENSYEMFKRTYAIEDFQSVSNKLEIDFQEYFRVMLQETCLYPKNNHFHYLGKNFISEKSHVSNWENAIQRHFYIDQHEIGVSELSIQYLDSLLTLCKDKGIFVGLVNTPVHHAYFENIPEAALARYEELKQKYLQEDIWIFDRADNDYPDNCFLNADHANIHGAERFTKELVEQLNMKGE